MPQISLMNFPYKKIPDGQYFPVIPVRLHYRSKFIDSSALIDSGATISIFKEDVANYLGISIEKGSIQYLGGVGGRIKGYIHRIEFDTAGQRFTSLVVFSREYFVSFNLLGRDSFFRHFKITFDEARRKVSLN